MAAQLSSNANKHAYFGNVLEHAPELVELECRIGTSCFSARDNHREGRQSVDASTPLPKSNLSTNQHHYIDDIIASTGYKFAGFRPGLSKQQFACFVKNAKSSQCMAMTSFPVLIEDAFYHLEENPSTGEAASSSKQKRPTIRRTAAQSPDIMIHGQYFTDDSLATVDNAPLHLLQFFNTSFNTEKPIDGAYYTTVPNSIEDQCVSIVKHRLLDVCMVNSNLSHLDYTLDFSIEEPIQVNYKALPSTMPNVYETNNEGVQISGLPFMARCKQRSSFWISKRHAFYLLDRTYAMKDDEEDVPYFRIDCTLVWHAALSSSVAPNNFMNHRPLSPIEVARRLSDAYTLNAANPSVGNAVVVEPLYEIEIECIYPSSHGTTEQSIEEINTFCKCLLNNWMCAGYDYICMRIQ